MRMGKGSSRRQQQSMMTTITILQLPILELKHHHHHHACYLWCVPCTQLLVGVKRHFLTHVGPQLIVGASVRASGLFVCR
jgi:hypothetical protein